jgi:hypothetical protein
VLWVCHQAIIIINTWCFWVVSMHLAQLSPFHLSPDFLSLMPQEDDMVIIPILQISRPTFSSVSPWNISQWQQVCTFSTALTHWVASLNRVH